MRILFWHPESEALFEEFEQVQIEKALTEFGIEDVTGLVEYENRFRDQKYLEQIKESKMNLGTSLSYIAELNAGDIVHEKMLNSRVFRSCLNCDHWLGFDKSELPCSKFKVLPPPKIIVFSCITHWIDGIPF